MDRYPNDRIQLLNAWRSSRSLSVSFHSGLVKGETLLFAVRSPDRSYCLACASPRAITLHFWQSSFACSMVVLGLDQYCRFRDCDWHPKSNPDESSRNRSLFIEPFLSCEHKGYGWPSVPSRAAIRSNLPNGDVHYLNNGSIHMKAHGISPDPR